MADRHVAHLLIGGGIASAACAARLREQGAEGSILLVGREPDPPYERPPLSKSYLRGASSREDALFKPESWYAENDVELLTRTNAMKLDPDGRTATLQTKEEISFDTALVATGAMVQILRIDGAHLDGVHYLRAFGNSDGIREDAASAERVVLVGGSYISAECASSLASEGKACTMVMIEDAPFEGSLGREAGERIGRLLESKGIELVTGATVGGFAGPEEGRVEGVRTEDGRELPADMVVVGAGVRPDQMLAQRSGLEVDDGVVCDGRLRTSADGVWAAGDVCSYDSELHGRRVRIEHWELAFQQGRHVADQMLGGEEAFREVPYFWSDLADWATIESLGPLAEPDRTVVRGEADDSFAILQLAGGRLVGAVSVGRAEDLPHARRLIATEADLSGHLEELADSGSDLANLKAS